MAWTDKPATPHMKKLCNSLGSEYEINQHFGLERIIYRDLGNGYEIEISGANTSSKNKPVSIFLWCTAPMRVVGCINDVPQNDIAECIDFMNIFSEYHKNSTPEAQKKLLELFQRDWTELKQFYMNS